MARSVPPLQSAVQRHRTFLQSGKRGKPIYGWNIFLACLLRVVLALAVRVTHLPIGNMKQHFGGLVKP